MVLNGALFLLVCAAARAAASGGDGPLLNGNFEYAPNRSQMNGSRVMGKYAIPYWKVAGFVEYIESGAKQDHMVLIVPEGRHAVRLGTESSIQQQLSVTRGKYYSITFSAARTCAQSEKLSVSIVPGDASGGELPVQTVYTSSGWDSYAWAFKAKQGVVSLIIHHGDDQVDDPACGPIVDAVAIRTLSPPHATHQNMLINGDFEEGPYMTPGSPSGVLVPPMDEDATSPLPGWTIMSHSKVVKYIDAGHFRVPHGSRAVELVAGVEVALVQEVATVPGRSYRLQVRVPRHGRLRARQARLQGGGEQHPGGVLQHGLPHHVRPQRHALRTRRRRRVARQRLAPACSPVAPLMRLAGASAFFFS
ncbi:unnamed protein product [Triticum turgidum subsp. durum]|uniref:DUF642 domain-containing protein n=1 Tax=Triticum turgidum subsp. durum TaxID=4567 RepID=A0A9R1RPB5_TRITD|nr:unnamed protein product [Triticum turgidum subsp. durum]